MSNLMIQSSVYPDKQDFNEWAVAVHGECREYIPESMWKEFFHAVKEMRDSQPRGRRRSQQEMKVDSFIKKFSK